MEPFHKRIRIQSDDDSPRRPFKTGDTLDTAEAIDLENMVYCHPAIVIQGSSCTKDLSRHRLWLFHAKSVLHDGKLYQIKTMSCSNNLPKPETPIEKDALREFKTKTLNCLSPLFYLRGLVSNGEIQKWYIPASLLDRCLTSHEIRIARGFTSGMADCPGRLMISIVLQELLETENITVSNCGGSSTSNNVTRTITFRYNTTRVEGMSYWTSSSSDTIPEKSDAIPTRTSPRVSSVKTPSESAQQEIVEEETRQFVPDVVVTTLVENTYHDLLIVEVKKGMELTHVHESQLKYELLPSAVCQGTAIGLLICAGEAILMKYTKIEEGNYLRFERDHYQFRDKCLLEDLVDMLCDLQYNLKNLNFHTVPLH